MKNKFNVSEQIVSSVTDNNISVEKSTIDNLKYKEDKDYEKDLERGEILDVLDNFWKDVNEFKKEEDTIEDGYIPPEEKIDEDETIDVDFPEPYITSRDVKKVIDAIKDMDIESEEKIGTVEIGEHFSKSSELANKLFIALSHFKYRDIVLKELNNLLDKIKKKEETEDINTEKIKPLLESNRYKRKNFYIKNAESVKEEIKSFKKELGITSRFLKNIFSSPKFNASLIQASKMVFVAKGSEYGSAIFFDVNSKEIYIPEPINGTTPDSTSMGDLESIFPKYFMLACYHFHPGMGFLDQIIIPSPEDLETCLFFRNKNKRETGYEFPPIEIVVQRILKSDRMGAEFKILMYQEPYDRKPTSSKAVFEPLDLSLNYDDIRSQDDVMEILQKEGYKCFVTRTVDKKFTAEDIKMIGKIFSAPNNRLNLTKT